jgi:hypothetical protein
MSAAEDFADGTLTGADTVQAELDVMRICATAIEGLGKDARARTLDWLVQRFGDAMSLERHRILTPAPTAAGSGNTPGAAAGSPDVTPKRFVQEKAPKTDVERITVLAYYLSHYRGIERFKTADLTALNTEAAQPRLSNAADAASNALKSSGLLAEAGKGLRQLTMKGEELVDALPDREAVKAVTEKYGTRRRRRPSRPGIAKAED